MSIKQQLSREFVLLFRNCSAAAFALELYRRAHFQNAFKNALMRHVCWVFNILQAYICRHYKRLTVFIARVYDVIHELQRVRRLPLHAEIIQHKEFEAGKPIKHLCSIAPGIRLHFCKNTAERSLHDWRKGPNKGIGDA